MNNFKFKVHSTTEPIIEEWLGYGVHSVTNGTFIDLLGDKWTSWTYEGLVLHLMNIFDTKIELCS